MVAASALALLGLLSLPAPAQTLVRFSGGETISRDDLAGYLAGRPDLYGSARDYWSTDAVLRNMATTRVLNLEGERLGIERGQARDQARFDDVYAHAVQAKLAPKCERPADAAAARRFFDENPQAFQIAPTARLTRIMLPSGLTVDGLSSSDWLAQRARSVAAGTTALADVAARAEALYPEQPQGDVGWVRLEGDNTVIRRLAEAKQGELVGPLSEGNFVYLYHLETKREGRPMRWEEAETSAAARALAYCRSQADTALRQALFEKYGVQVDEQAVRALFAASEVPGKQR